MPDRLPRELRVLYEVARVVGDGPHPHGEALARVTACVRDEFAFERVRFVRRRGEPGDEEALADARVARAAVVRDGRVAVPLFVGGECTGFLVADRGGDRLDASRGELQLLSAVGLLAGLLVAQAEQASRLERALEELRRANDLKGEFVSIASHELRSPIAVVHGIATTLHERYDDLDEEKRRALRGALLEQSARLRDLAEQLLDLSRVDAGRLRLDSRPFRPREAVESLLPRVAADRLDDVEVELDPRVELVCDPAAFERIVGNLLANALKYGQPPVLVRGRDGDGYFRLAVEDRGPGVEPALVPELFDSFTRGEDARRKGTIGAGLGLAIARRYAEALGGELLYERGREGGARFVLVLERSED